jgi:hypothetical protein
MTAAGFPMGDDRLTVRTPDPERMLEGYADLTRIQASAAVVRRFQVAVAEERAAEQRVTGRIRSLPLRLGIGRAARGIPSRPVPWFQGVRFTVQLQGLALLLLLVLTLGLVAGGAGATIASLLQGPHRGSEAPGLLLVPEPAPVTAPTPTPAPTMRAVPLAQRVSAGPEKAGKAVRPGRTDKARRPGRAPETKRRSDAAWVTPACVSDGGPHVSHRSCAF